jgi:hypothetical protein
MPKSLSEILSTTVLTEDGKSELEALFEARVNEVAVKNREEVSAELREEFATRYVSDKKQIVSAMDAMLKNTLTKELTEFAEDRNAVIAERVKYKKVIKSHTKVLEKFINQVLTKEIRELREDRKSQKSDFGKLEAFVLKRLTGELNEFHSDKRALAAREVKMVKEGEAKIAQAKKLFIKEASTKLAKLVKGVMHKEITTLRESIQTAKENDFGRKIFETFASEFMTSTLSEGTQVGKLAKQIVGLKKNIVESAKTVDATKQQLSEANRKVRVAQDLAERKNILGEMLSPLNKNQAALMRTLLETVATKQLRTAYTKYLPNVLSENKAPSNQKKTAITESKHKIITGNRKPSVQPEAGGSADIIKLRTLAGLDKEVRRS